MLASTSQGPRRFWGSTRAPRESLDSSELVLVQEAGGVWGGLYGRRWVRIQHETMRRRDDEMIDHKQG